MSFHCKCSAANIYALWKWAPCFSTPFCFFHPGFAFSTLPYDLAGLIDPPSLPALSRSWLGGLSNPQSSCLSNPYLSLVTPGQPCTMGSIHAQIGVCVHPAGLSFRPSTVPSQPQWLPLRRPGQPLWRLLSPFAAS